jgi:HSP20 family molecular chaperone IbpA
MPLDDMLREFDRVMSRLQSLSRYRPFAESVLSMWNGGSLGVDVSDQGHTVKVAIAAPGVPRELRDRWAMRVSDESLIVKGELLREMSVRHDNGRMASERSAETFIRVVPLPCPVEQKPESVKYRDGVLTIVLRKRTTHPGEGWVDLTF